MIGSRPLRQAGGVPDVNAPGTKQAKDRARLTAQYVWGASHLPDLIASRGCHDADGTMPAPGSLIERHRIRYREEDSAPGPSSTSTRLGHHPSNCCLCVDTVSVSDTPSLKGDQTGAVTRRHSS